MTTGTWPEKTVYDSKEKNQKIGEERWSMEKPALLFWDEGREVAI